MATLKPLPEIVQWSNEVAVEPNVTQPEIAQHWVATRTSTEYSEVPFEQLSERGVDIVFLESLMKELPIGCVVAGGYMTSLFSGDKINDIDIFFTSKEAYEKLVIKMKSPPGEGGADLFKDYIKVEVPQHLKDRFDSYKHSINPTNPPIQLIKLAFYESPEHVIDTFDFTAAQIAVAQTGSGVKIFMNPMAPMDIARKRIVLHRMTFPASTMRRLIKYSARGYFACPGALTKIAEETAKVYNQNPSMVRQVVSVD